MKITTAISYSSILDIFFEQTASMQLKHEEWTSLVSPAFLKTLENLSRFSTGLAYRQLENATIKELSLCHKLWFSNHYIFGTSSSEDIVV